MNELEFAQRFLGQFKVKGSEIVPKYCPSCNGGNSRDQDTFALNTDKHTYNCKRGSCGISGHFGKLCKEYGVESDRDIEYKQNRNYEMNKPKPKVYKKPEKEVIQPTDKVLKYLQTRKISEEAMKKYRVGADDNGNIIFPYYDEEGNHVLNKFKLSHKFIKGKDRMKSWREEGGKPVLWGMWLCDTEKPLIITEGEPDTLAIATCGIENVVSVPSGAEDLTWIDVCWEWLEKFDKIIIWGDKDEPGKQMTRNIVSRLGAERCWIVSNNRKDANETLFYDGRAKVVELVKSAVEVPIHGLTRLADVVDVDHNKTPKIKSGIKDFDKSVGGFALGELSVWTGVNASGKSTFLGQMIIEAVEQDFSVCAYSGELSAQRFRDWIELQMAGKENLLYEYNPILEKDMPKISKQNKDKMRQWYYDKLFLHDSFGGAKSDDMLKVFEYSVKRYGCKVFLVDNLMTTFYEGAEKDFYRQQSLFVGQLIDFAHKYNVHIHLVAHPRKQQGELAKQDIAGTGDITNRADNVFSISRVGEDDEENSNFDNKLTILKNRMYGVQDKIIPLLFDAASKRMYRTPNEGLKNYGWCKVKQMPELEQVEVGEICPF